MHFQLFFTNLKEKFFICFVKCLAIFFCGIHMHGFFLKCLFFHCSYYSGILVKRNKFPRYSDQKVFDIFGSEVHKPSFPFKSFSKRSSTRHKGFYILQPFSFSFLTISWKTEVTKSSYCCCELVSR